MGEGSIAPSMFSGKTTDNPGDWLRQFENYALYKGLTDEQLIMLIFVARGNGIDARILHQVSRSDVSLGKISSKGAREGTPIKSQVSPISRLNTKIR